MIQNKNCIACFMLTEFAYIESTCMKVEVLDMAYTSLRTGNFSIFTFSSLTVGCDIVTVGSQTDVLDHKEKATYRGWWNRKRVCGLLMVL